MQGRPGVRWVMRRTCSQLHLGQKLEGRENKGPTSVQVWVGKTRSPQRQIRAGGWTMVSHGQRCVKKQPGEFGDQAEETGRRMSEERGGPAGKGDPTLGADGREVGSVPGITEKGEGVDHKGRAGLRRVAGSSDLPLGVLVGSGQGRAQSPQLGCTWKLRGKCHKMRRMCSLLPKAARPSPASLQSVG